MEASTNFMTEKATCVFEPPDIFLDDHVMSLQFSPVANVLAVGQITGHVRVYSYKNDATVEQMAFDYHKESVRAIDFSEDGNMIYTASADKSLAVVTNGKMAG